jgi:hypothetical protein
VARIVLLVVFVLAFFALRGLYRFFRYADYRVAITVAVLLGCFMLGVLNQLGSTRLRKGFFMQWF